MFSACTYNSPDEAGSDASERKTDPMEASAEIVQKTGAVLVNELQQQIEQNGPTGAINYCNHHALSITDSLAIQHHASVRRTSLKPRNPLNKASESEKEILLKWEIDHNKGNKPQPYKITNPDGTISVFHPIFTAEICLNCHGVPGEDIGDETLASIESLYPEDQAIDYSVNQLRGMWVVRLSK